MSCEYAERAVPPATFVASCVDTYKHIDRPAGQQETHRRCRFLGRISRVLGASEKGQCRPPADSGMLGSCSQGALGPASGRRLPTAVGLSWLGGPCALQELELPLAGAADLPQPG